ncbi:MAG: 16S rRNA (uracil(1498)-N(3))-methyltransferase [Thermodesulfovibrionia bacterium]|nr:16S rRNA (uracil(1498)-N(3))-methyltransferase [Thermodesulfovibrionia bacterium]
MARIFLPPEQLLSKEIIITGENARYLSLVLRAKPGEFITILNGNGKRYICKIITVHKKAITVENIKEELYSSESPISITLIQGLPKGDKMDHIIQKSTELGVNKIVPLITERSQIRTSDKVSRWRKIALSASQQSGREIVPEIIEPIDFNKLCDTQPNTAEDIGSLKLLFSESLEERNLKQVLNNCHKIKNITILVGPEGGFSKQEISIVVAKGFTEVSLGPRTLRTETSPITAISIIQYVLGDVG